MGLSPHSLSDEVLYMTMLTGVRLQHGSKVGICTSTSLLRCLCCTAVVLLCSLCPVVNKSVPYWQIPDTNGTSSRFMELLDRSNFDWWFHAWPISVVLAFAHSFQHQKTVWLKTPCTVLMSSPVCMFTHLADGMFLYANHECWDIYIHAQGESVYTAKSYLSENWGHICFHMFLFQDRESENKTGVQLFL